MSEPTEHDVTGGWFAAVISRLSFELSYTREPSRRISYTGIDGPAIDDSVVPGRQSTGVWSQDSIGEQRSERGIVNEAFNAALNEAVHEALEWFKLDGTPLLDPHDPLVEDDIYVAVRTLSDTLFTLAAQRTDQLAATEGQTTAPTYTMTHSSFRDTGMVPTSRLVELAEQHGFRAACRPGTQRVVVEHTKGDGLLEVLQVFKAAGWVGEPERAYREDIAAAWPEPERSVRA